MRKKGVSAKSNIVYKTKPNSSIPSDTPSAEIQEIVRKRVEMEKAEHNSETEKNTTSLPIIHDEEEEEPSLTPLPKDREPNQLAIISFFMRIPLKTKGKPLEKDDSAGKAQEVESMSYGEEHIPLIRRKLLKKKMIESKAIPPSQKKSDKEQ